MNAELDLLLASYLDDELDPELRRRVELLIRTDPAAASRFAVLTRTRDLLASLPPPETCPDVSLDVVATIRRRQRLMRKNAIVALSVFGSLAASAIAIAVSRPALPTVVPNGLEVVRNHPKPALVLPTPPASLLAITAVPVAPTLEPLREEVLKAETQVRDDRASLASLLEQGAARLVNVVVDDLGPASLNLVDAAIDATHRVRPKHAKIHLIQGVEIDPLHPGKACVYVLVMDEFEYAQFRDRLQERLPDAASEPVAAPEKSLANLTSVGRIEIFNTKKPAGTLMPPAIPGNGLFAIRPPKVEDVKTTVVDGRPGQPRTLEGDAAKSDADTKSSRSVADAAKKAEAPTRSVFLVMVSPRDRNRQ